MTKRFFCFLAVLLLFCLPITSSCAKPQLKVHTYIYFGYPLSVVIKADKDFDKHVSEIDKILKEISAAVDAKNTESDVYKFNNAESGEEIEFSKTGAEILRYSLSLYEKTNGAFNPLIFPLVELWGFSSDKMNDKSYVFSIPSGEEIALALQAADIGNVSLQGSTVIKLNKSAKLDFSAVIKGFAADKITEYLKQSGVKNGYVNMAASSISFLEGEKGNDFIFSAVSPDNTDKTLFTLKIKNAFVSSSGTYQRFYKYDGKTYSHIIDVKTGKPIDNGITGVTVFTSPCALTDAFSTALAVMGKDEIINFVTIINSESNNKITVFVTVENGGEKTLITNSHSFTLENGDYTVEYF